MEYFPAPLENLVEQFARLPGIGGKSAQRLAFHVLSLPMEEAQAFAGMMQLLRQGAFDGQDDLLFVHTGGTAALFAIDLTR